MPRRKATEESTVDEQVAMEGITGEDPAPGARPRRGRSVSTRAGNRSKIPARTASGRIPSKAQMVAEVHAQVEMFLTLGVALWSTRDEDCASVASPERVNTFAESTTALIARSPKLLAYAAKSGVIGEIFKLASAALPIAVAVVRAHGPGGHGHKLEEITDVDGRFPAFAAAP